MDRKWLALSEKFLKNKKFRIGKGISDTELAQAVFTESLFNYHSEDIMEYFSEYLNAYLHETSGVSSKDLIRFENSSRYSGIKFKIV